MIRVFYGDDRMRANQEIKKLLGTNYEIIEGVEIEIHDLPNIFLGNSLLADKRKILIRDLSEEKLVCEKIIDYINTPHEIVDLETKVNKKSTFYKTLQNKLEFREFKLPEISVYREALDIYNMAKKDGKKAVAMLEKIKLNQDPIAFIGMIASITLKEFEAHPTAKEKRVLEELSKLDIETKSTSFSPWTLLQAFLLRLASL